MSHPWPDETCPNAIAVIGMAGRFCAAPNLDAFWHNLCEGYEAARRLSAGELEASGCLQSYASHPSFVPVCAQMEDVDKFDAAFFGLSSSEARDMDPQLRLMLESAWHAFENAGYAPRQAENEHTRVGVFTGAAPSSYWLCNVGPDAFNNTGTAFHKAAIVNGQDFLSSWISYKFGFTGPSLNIQTACSTGLVLVASACQHLLDFSCDIAVAATASVINPRGWGYVAESGGILAPDGHCRPFDAAAGGTLPGEGAGAVVLRRLEDALSAGDRIEAVIHGYGISNDGSHRAGFAAPSADGQALAISLALSMAGVESRDIGYVEAHGTGTYLGDPIEIAGLSKVFQSRPAPCPTGSLKGNLGHLGNAAGMASLLKVILMLRHRHIPPTINFRTLNPAISLDSARFVIATQNMPWEAPARQGATRLAGISSFGFGGTNCHLIVGEAPPGPEAGRQTAAFPGADISSAAPHDEDCALVITAPDEEGLQRCLKVWGEFFLANPDLSLPELAWNLRHARTLFAWRCVLTCTEVHSAGRALLGLGTDSNAAQPGPRDTEGMEDTQGTTMLFSHGPCPQRPCLVPVVDPALPAQQLTRLVTVLQKAAILPLCALVAAIPPEDGCKDEQEHTAPGRCASPDAAETVLMAESLLRELRALLPASVPTASLLSGPDASQQPEAAPDLPPLLPGSELVFLHVCPNTAARTHGEGGTAPRLRPADAKALSRACRLPDACSQVPMRALRLELPADAPLPCTALMAHLLAAGFAPKCARNTARRLELPFYPFARTSYWLPLRSRQEHSGAAGTPAACAPEGAFGTQPDSPGPGPDELVLEIWREAFEQDDLDMDSDFYALGGSSMTAVQILADVESVFGLRVSMNQFSAIRTPAQLLDLLTRMAEQAEQPAGTA